MKVSGMYRDLEYPNICERQLQSIQNPEKEPVRATADSDSVTARSPVKRATFLHRDLFARLKMGVDLEGMAQHASCMGETSRQAASHRTARRLM